MVPLRRRLAVSFLQPDDLIPPPASPTGDQSLLICARPPTRVLLQETGAAPAGPRPLPAPSQAVLDAYARAIDGLQEGLRLSGNATGCAAHRDNLVSSRNPRWGLVTIVLGRLLGRPDGVRWKPYALANGAEI